MPVNSEAIERFLTDTTASKEIKAFFVAVIDALHPLVQKAITEERARCAGIAQKEKVSGETGTPEDEAYNDACDTIVARIWGGE